MPGKRLVATTKQEEKRRINTRNACLIAACVSLVMSILNIVNRSFVMMISTAILFVLYLIMFIITKSGKGNFKAIRVACAGVTSMVFSWYVLTGGQEGFSAIWLTLIPPVYFMCFGFTIGYAASVYFLLLLMGCFWTPYRNHFQEIYSPVFMNRFPVVFIAVFALAYIIARQLFLYEASQEKHEKELHDAVLHERQRVEHFSMDMALTIVSAVDAKDEYTNQHSRRVALYTAEICKEMGWTQDKCTNAFYIALMHDVGKIGVPDSILTKNGRLTEEEFDKIKLHTGVGAKILMNITTFEGIADGALYHHERYDGTGYHGLREDNIPLIGRIIAVADCIDAMHSKRVYSEARPMSVIAEEIRRCSGTQFDPAIAEVALHLIEKGAFDGSDTVIQYRIDHYLRGNTIIQTENN